MFGTEGDRGIIPRAASQIFNGAALRFENDELDTRAWLLAGIRQLTGVHEVSIRCSFLEVYRFVS